jgi:hypothetical protein
VPKSPRDPFWSKVYGTLIVLCAIGLLALLATGDTTLFVGSLLAFMVIGIIAMDADRQAEKRERRQNKRKPTIGIPDYKLTHDLRDAMHRLDKQEERDRRVRSETAGMGSVGDLEDIRRKP